MIRENEEQECKRVPGTMQKKKKLHIPDTRYFSGQKNKGPCVPVLIMMCQLIPGIYSWGIVYTIIYNINNIYTYMHRV